MNKDDIKGIFFLLTFSIIAALVFNSLSSFKIPLFGQWDTDKGIVFADPKKIENLDKISESTQITNIEIVKKIIQNKNYLIFDVRQKELYDKGHLPNALSVPLKEFDSIIGKLLDTIEPESYILVYCSGFECMDSHNFTKKLKAFGFKNIKIFSGGFKQWEQLGYKIEKN